MKRAQQRLHDIVVATVMTDDHVGHRFAGSICPADIAKAISVLAAANDLLWCISYKEGAVIIRHVEKMLAETEARR
jgi:hypothetical protein